ncbi:MAG: hypothetical protein IKP65_01385 [Alphaproteobacteria bacterium]|nr:hypothetical protein [Alphaproteobacteria bacterium]
MNKFTNAFNKADDIEFYSFKFDEPDYEALMVNEESYLEHLRVQAAGIAYYGNLAKKAERDYEELEKSYRQRYNEMYSECSDTLSRLGKKNNIREVEALVQCKYEKELEKWEKELKEYRENRDGINQYYEAWKAKGFTLNSMTSLITAGLLTPKTVITEEDMIKNKKMNVEQAGSILANHKTAKKD